MLFQTLAGLTLAARVATAATIGADRHSWGAGRFKSLVSFGDSYTDDSRLGYFINNNGSAPPVGWVNPPNYNSASGGRPWPQYVHQYSGIQIYNYAVSGAVCSNNISPRFFSAINADFPDIESYELPAFLADKAYTDPATNKPFLNIPPSKTVYSIWIGTNDLDYNSFLTNSQVRGTNLTTYTDCVYEQMSRLYDSGARYFVLINAAPLQLTPLYGLPDAGGVGPNQYWKNKPDNLTDISYRMAEEVATVNNIYKYRTPVEVLVEKNFKGANVALFDMYSLISDIYYHPAQYLNGTTEPLSVTGVGNTCTVNATCTRSTSPDSYLWFDDLHPSEQADRVFAREFIGVLDGKSKWASYFSG
ncbi:acetylesterase-1 [Elsinoe australis]|uniref:Acetylesterase-1 n=1 Tax=Elsinoe australis TaxID=40998 RepID=A0A4U7BDG3_9PEZI|nr:acetylesterase-1 [Elsinoe australis]